MVIFNEIMENFIINNNINNINEEFDEPKINIVFQKHSDFKTIITISNKA